MSTLQKFVTAGAVFGVFIFGFFAYKGYFSKKQSFYLGLKRRKDRSRYRLRKISQINSSIVECVLEEGNLKFLFTLSFYDEDIVRVLINDYDKTRYIIQDVILQNELSDIEITFEDNKKEKKVFCFCKSLSAEISYGDNISLEIYKNNEILVSFNPRNQFCITDNGFSADFLFSEAKKAYGLAQHAENVTLQETPYQLYNADTFGTAWQNWNGLYGSVPLLYAQGTNKTSGILWLNASETYVELSYEAEGVHSTFFSESGALEFFILSGTTLKDCIKQNAKLTGVAPLPPLFSLGYHQSRYSYTSQDDVTQVCDSFDKYDLPLDCIWLDLDCTDGKRYFTWNPQTYRTPDKMLQYLDKRGRKAVVISDPHIKVDSRYHIYTQCEQLGYFVKAANNKTFKGICWPGKSAWIDFFNPKARQFYSRITYDFAKQTNLFIWNDMNEPAVYQTEDTTMPKSCVHYGGFKHKDVHNLYGFYQTMSTFEGLRKRKNLRPFILTRSHFAGSQRFACIWTGDNVADWHNLKLSISMCLTHSLVGFSFCGADVGGYFGDPSEELLQRWYQLGAWLPFFRGHSNIDFPRREPYLYRLEVLQNIRRSISDRYRHLWYWYTLFWEHTLTSEPVIRPLFYESFVTEDVNVDSEFLVGENILVCPVLDEKTSSTDVFLPGKQSWFNNQNNKKYDPGFYRILVDINAIPVFYRSGSIIPIIETKMESSSMIYSCPITLYIYCTDEETAVGTLYFDDTKSFDYLTKSYTYTRFELKNLEICGEKIDDMADFNGGLVIGTIHVHGLKSTVTGAKFNDLHLLTQVVDDVIIIKDVNLKCCNNFIIKLY